MGGSGKISRYVGTAIFASAMTCMIGFMWGRTSGHAELGLAFGKGLKYTLYVMVACAAYMAFVGIYHTFLAVMGWDGQPGLFSQGERSGPMSSPPRSSPPSDD